MPKFTYSISTHIVTDNMSLKLSKVSMDDEKGGLKDICFTLKDGEFVAITGESRRCMNLMNVMGCLEIPSSGKVVIDGINVMRISEKEREMLRLKKMGFVFRDDLLMQTLTVKENIEILMREAGTPRSMRKKKIKEILRIVGMEKKENFYPHQLSITEKHAVCLARSLANDPKIIFVEDMPRDIEIDDGRTMLDVLREINRKMGVTVVIRTNRSEIAKESDTTIKVKKRKVVLD